METYNGPRAFLIETKTILFAMVSGLSIFMIIALYMSGGSLALSFDAKDPLTLIALLSMVAIPIGYIISNRTFKSFTYGSTLKDKLPVYQKGFLIRLACCEGPGLISVVCLLLTSNLLFVILTAIALVTMVINFPTAEKIGEVMGLTPPEVEAFAK